MCVCVHDLSGMTRCIQKGCISSATCEGVKDANTDEWIIEALSEALGRRPLPLWVTYDNTHTLTHTHRRPVLVEMDLRRKALNPRCTRSALSFIRRWGLWAELFNIDSSSFIQTEEPVPRSSRVSPQCSACTAKRSDFHRVLMLKKMSDSNMDWNPKHLFNIMSMEWIKWDRIDRRAVICRGFYLNVKLKRTSEERFRHASKQPWVSGFRETLNLKTSMSCPPSTLRPTSNKK